MSTGYLYKRSGELSRPPVPLFNRERSSSFSYLGVGLTKRTSPETWKHIGYPISRLPRRSSSAHPIPELPWGNGSSEHENNLHSFVKTHVPEEGERESGNMDHDQRLNSKRQRLQHGLDLSEPTSVLDLHMAPSPGSSTSGNSVYESPDSSRCGTTTPRPVQTLSSTTQDLSSCATQQVLPPQHSTSQQLFHNPHRRLLQQPAFPASSHSFAQRSSFPVSPHAPPDRNSSTTAHVGLERKSSSSPHSTSPEQSFLPVTTLEHHLDSHRANDDGNSTSPNTYETYVNHMPFDEINRPSFRRCSLFNARSNKVAISSSSLAWMNNVRDSHDASGMLDQILSVLEYEAVLPTLSTSNSHDHERSELDIVVDSCHEVVRDSNFAEGSREFVGFESVVIPEVDEIFTDPLCELPPLDEHDEVTASTFLPITSSDHLIKFDNSQVLSNQSGTLSHVHDDHPPPSNFCADAGIYNVKAEGRAGFRNHSMQQQQQCEALQQQEMNVEREKTAADMEREGLYLLQLLLHCAKAVEMENYKLGRSMLEVLTSLAFPFGDPMKRIAVYFGDALAEQIAAVSEITGTTYIHTIIAASFQPHMLMVDECVKLPAENCNRELIAYEEFYKHFPYGWFADFTATDAILDAVGPANRIHVVDLDIRHGIQWPNLIQALSLRRSSPVHLRITGVGPVLEALEQVGSRLCESAKGLQVTLEYRAVLETSLGNLDAEVLRLHHGEALAVHCGDVLNRSLGDGTLADVLRMIRRLNPVVMTVVEAEAHDNTSSFFDRFNVALEHYSALFDNLEEKFSRYDKRRLRIEKYLFAPVVKSILESRRCNRIARHIRLDDWRTIFRQAGFRDLPFSSRALEQAALLLSRFNSREYNLTGDRFSLTLGWQAVPIVTISAWTNPITKYK